LALQRTYALLSLASRNQNWHSRITGASVMLKEDIIEVTAYLMENYRRIKNMSGKEVAAFFENNNLYDFAKRQYDFLHIESPEANVITIDEFVSNG